MATKSYQPPRTGFGGQAPKTGKKPAAPQKLSGANIDPFGGGTPQSYGVPSQQSQMPYAMQNNRVNGPRTSSAQVDAALAALRQPLQPPPGGAPGVANADWAGVASTGQYGAPTMTPPGGSPGGVPNGGGGGGSLATPPLGYSNLGLSQTLYSGDAQTRNSFAMNWLLQNGLTDNPAVAELVGDIITPGLYQFMLQTGGSGDQSDAAVANYIVDQFVKLTTPGAAMNNPGDMLGALFSATGDSPLGSAIGYGTALPQDQVNQNDAFLQSAIYGLNPLAQRAYMNASDAAGMKYLAGANQDPTQMSNYGDFLRTQGISGWRL